MSFVLAPVIALFHYALQPLPVFAWLGAPVSALDVAGALRLAVALRQVRELYHDQHVTKANHKNRSGGKTSGKAQRVAADETLEPRSRARDFIATLVIVHGGEAIVAPWLGLRPAFFVSSTSSMTFLGAHALVDLLPTLPSPSLHTEVPLTIVHAFFRSILLCNVVPRVVAGHASPAVAASSYTLLLSAWVVQILANGGPFVSNLFSLLRPTQIEVATPPELLSYGWTATDFWSPMLVTGLYATLTHAQPFFTSIHSLLFAFFWPFGLVRLSDATTKSGGSAGRHQGVVAPVDHETARAVCAIVLCALNVNRAMRAYGPGYAAIITQIANAASAAKPGAVKPLPEPSLDDEKSEHSPEEDIVDTKRKGRAESATSRGE
ncbi:hypothetical protein DFH94DRAFT_632236 [Russula ochroleuca]|uniref:Uncharacterized protein n=1 Tax=Russula ochroleuca TaxID=152965 RepID=A0A9P5T883_9AGAM|nr:hypothetical protein DFH94DRAFT_632236 [Russula ochroleuca]